ncbi:PREDICTED: ATP-citrate synthase-like, partial [Acropora digitifera]|uniref:ATP-citrate synthase-like n=1 Tax=Acropora digitifera TaxID=70779 RepID=UPI00077A394F
VVEESIHVLDLAAKLDQTAEFICKSKWGEIDFPPPFGREAFPEEAYISELDAKSGASLKLTILNSKGRIWTMVAGGGASVVYRCVPYEASLFHWLSEFNKCCN